jgi:hypothetical protein
MLKYYLIGNWMGSFRTSTVTESLSEFLEWKEKYNPVLDDSGIYRLSDGGRVVFLSISDDCLSVLGNLHIGL